MDCTVESFIVDFFTKVRHIFFLVFLLCYMAIELTVWKNFNNFASFLATRELHFYHVPNLQTTRIWTVLLRVRIWTPWTAHTALHGRTGGLDGSELTRSNTHYFLQPLKCSYPSIWEGNKHPSIWERSSHTSEWLQKKRPCVLDREHVKRQTIKGNCGLHAPVAPTASGSPTNCKSTLMHKSLPPSCSECYGWLAVSLLVALNPPPTELEVGVLQKRLGVVLLSGTWWASLKNKIKHQAA